MNQTETLNKLSRLLRHKDREIIDQGVELALSLNDPALLKALLEGASLRMASAQAKENGMPDLTLPKRLKPRSKYLDQGVRYAFYKLLCGADDPTVARLRSRVVGLEWHYMPGAIDLARLTALQTVSFADAGSAIDFKSLRALPALKKLIVWRSNQSLEDLASGTLETLGLHQSYGALFTPGAMPALTSVTLYDVGALTDLTALAGSAAITSLEATHCARLTSLDGAAAMPALEHLSLANSACVTSLEPLRGLARLKSLDLSYTGVRDLSALASLPALERVVLDGAPVASLDALSGLRHLELVSFAQCPALTRLDGLPERLLRSELMRPTSLRLDAMPALRSLRGVEPTFERVVEASLSMLPALPSLAGMAAPALRALTLTQLAGLTSLDGLGASAQIERLSIDECPSLQDLSALSGCASLRVLGLTGCATLSDLTALAGCASLEVIDLRDSPSITDLSPLEALPKLRTIAAHGTKVKRDALSKRLRKACLFAVHPPPERMILS